MRDYVSENRKEAGFEPPKLRKFDVEVGDIVRCTDRHDDRFGAFEETMNKYNKWKVEKIHKWVFTCRNHLGIAASFSKVDYQTGKVEKVRQ